MKLAAYGNAWIEFEYNHDSSSYRRRLLRSSQRSAVRAHCGIATVVGFWPYFGRTFIAKYRFRDAIWLRVGSARWNLDVEQVEIIRRSDGKQCRVQIFHRQVLQFERTYRDPRTTWFARIDPTYDYLDMESDDIFLSLSRSGLSEESRSLAREVWQDGAQ